MYPSSEDRLETIHKLENELAAAKAAAEIARLALIEVRCCPFNPPGGLCLQCSNTVDGAKMLLDNVLNLNQEGV